MPRKRKFGQSTQTWKRVTKKAVSSADKDESARDGGPVPAPGLGGPAPGSAMSSGDSCFYEAEPVGEDGALKTVFKKCDPPTPRPTIRARRRRRPLRGSMPKPEASAFYQATHVGDLKTKLQKCEPPSDVFTSEYRIMNLDILSKSVGSLTLHAATCERAVQLAQLGQSPLRLICESRKFGMASVLMVQCCGCLEKFFIETSPKMEMKDGTRRYEINVRGVWGEMSSGGGSAKLNECLSTMGIGGLSRSNFSDIEYKISLWWKSALQADMLEAGQEERELAIKRGEFDEGVPATTVVLDGGWGKRSHKHTYNSLCGVVVVIGFHSKKLLHLEVRNKYCAVCTYAERLEKNPRDHTCFKNWNESSQAMEADGALSAFSECEELHGLRYLKIIADGDSSVLATLVSKGPSWCCRIKKLLCSNHACKGLRSKLENLVSENPHYKGQGGLTKEARVKIASGVRCAIRMRSREENRQSAIKKLKHDILNSMYHVLGIHNSCSADFCKVKGQAATGSVNVDHKEADDTHPTHPEEEPEDELEETLSQQIRYWTEGFSEQAMEDARGGFTASSDVVIDKSLAQDVMKILNGVADKAEVLIGNYTSNLAENWMSIRMKFDGGKVINRCQRGSWHGRCYGASLRRNVGVEWSPKTWELATGIPASDTFKRHFKDRLKHHEQSLKSQSSREVQARAKKRKFQRLAVSTSKKARLSYGEGSVEVCDDVPEDQLKKAKEDFYNTNVVVDKSASERIETATRKQSLSGLWHTERRKRLTASNFGKIQKMRKTTPVGKTVSSLLYSTFKGTSATRHGLQQERFTVQEYELYKASQGVIVTVEPRGLVVNPKFPFLGASADGHVVESRGDNRTVGIIEIKNVLHNKNMTLKDAALKDKQFCLEFDDISDSLKLRKNHNYHSQIQGQLAVIDSPWCDFVVRCVNPNQLHVERIFRDEDYWMNVMFPKLKAFYFDALLPELSIPRYGKQPGIREPGESWVPVCQPYEPTAGPSGLQKTTPKKSRSGSKGRKSGGTKTRKIVGKKIQHKWEDADTGEEKWFLGTVLNVLDGEDGESGAEYEVKYENDDEVYAIDCLLMDLKDGSLKIL